MLIAGCLVEGIGVRVEQDARALAANQPGDHVGHSRVAGADFGAEPARKNNPQLRFRLPEFPGQLESGAAAGNQHVGQKQVNEPLKLLPGFQRLRCRSSRQDHIAALAQNLTHHLQHHRVVFDQKDGLRPAGPFDGGCHESISKIFHAR